ncbi:MAG TPA: class I SAM-dependent methyltransferase [Burkholderiales bacterium]|nr:class I SAM-dependent methyltransferase [Burkholderiales bacterium]
MNANTIRGNGFAFFETTFLRNVTTPGKPLINSPRLRRYFRDENERLALTREIFDHSADRYDQLEWWTGLGRGPSYRREALRRAGLAPGMRVLDVGTGTGLVAREALKLIGTEGQLTGLDPSPAMLAEARKVLPIETVVGYAEAIPLPGNQFDFLSMGYALRHVTDLDTTFREYLRVLKPGGTVCILEMAKPGNWLLRALLKFHLRYLVPALARALLRRHDSAQLWEYFWETIEACVPPATIRQALEKAGFAEVRSRLTLGILREYYARKPQ